MKAPRRFLCGAAALSASLVAPAPAEADNPPEPTMMIIEFPQGAPMIGFPRRCPDAPDDESEGEAICMAELYQGRAEVIRHLSGPPTNRELVRLTAHARRWLPGLRMLVAAVPFHDGDVSGLFAYWWHLPEANGDFCLAGESLQRLDESPIRRAFVAGYHRRFRARGHLEAVDFRCIRD